MAADVLQAAGRPRYVAIITDGNGRPFARCPMGDGPSIAHRGIGVVAPSGPATDDEEPAALPQGGDHGAACHYPTAPIAP